MSSALKSNHYEWMRCGDEIFPVMLAAIGAAQESVRLETYIYAGDDLGKQFRDALVSASQRDVKVSVLLDALRLAIAGRELLGPVNLRRRRSALV